MIYIICWNEQEVVRIEKVGNLYISSVDKDGYIYATHNGLMRGLLSCAKIESHKLPPFITNRVRDYEYLNEDEVIARIKETECRSVTDKVSVKVVEE